MDARFSGFPALRKPGSYEDSRGAVRYPGGAEAYNGWANIVGRPVPRVSSAEHQDCELALREALRQLHTDQRRRWSWWRRLLWR